MSAVRRCNEGSSSTHDRSTPAAAASPPANAGHRGLNRHPPGIFLGSGGSPTNRGRPLPPPSGTTLEERLRVRVERIGQHRLRGTELDDATQVHHRDAIRHRPREPQVVGHDDDADAVLFAQLQQELEDLPADGRIEVRHGLVRHDQPGLQREGTGDDHALALTARELVRESEEEPVRRTEAGPGQRLGDEFVLRPGERCGSEDLRPPRRRRSGEGSTSRWGLDRPSAPGGGTPSAACRAARPRTGSGPGPAW